MRSKLPPSVLMILKLWTYLPPVFGNFSSIYQMATAINRPKNIAIISVECILMVAFWTYLYWFWRPVKSERWSIFTIIACLALAGFCMAMVPIAIFAPSFGGHIDAQSVMWAAKTGLWFAPSGAYFIRLIWPDKRNTPSVA